MAFRRFAPWGVAVVAFAGGVQGAKAADPDLDAIAACASIPASSERLACFDKAIAAIEDAADALAAGDAPTSSELASAQARAGDDAGSDDTGGDGAVDDRTAAASAVATGLPESDFGKERVPVKRPESDPELRAVAVSISRNRRGKYIVVLENGQIWRQISSDTNDLPMRATDGSEVIIKKRALGSYALRIPSAKRSILVSRLK